jgi:hypothetical protein
MSIAHEMKKQRKPHRGGTVLPGANRSAPTGLEGFVLGEVAIDMPLLWSWRNQSRQPAPGVRLAACRVSLARRGCALRSA